MTWLFWIAAICLNAVALSIDYESRFASALILGQLFVVSGWFAVGRSHPLSRAAWLAVAIALVVAPDYVIPRLRSNMHQDVVWPHVLALTIVGASFTAVATALWAALLRGVSMRPADKAPAVIRFSVASCLGWMMVVAVGSTALRVADFSLLTEQTLGWISGVGMAGVAAVAMAAWLGDHRGSALTRGVSLVAVIVLATLVFIDQVPRDATPILWGAWAFVAAWIAVMRLDDRVNSSPITLPDELDQARPTLRLIANDC